MFGHVAINLLKLMGRRETVPGAIGAKDIPDALNQLRKGLANQENTDVESKSTDKEDEAEAPVSIGTRSGPLIEMLEAAVNEGVAVMWERQ